MDIIHYKDGSNAAVARYVVGDIDAHDSAIDYGQNRRKAVDFARKATHVFDGSHTSLDVIAIGDSGDPIAVWRVCGGSIGKRIDP